MFNNIPYINIQSQNSQLPDMCNYLPFVSVNSSLTSPNQLILSVELTLELYFNLIDVFFDIPDDVNYAIIGDVCIFQRNNISNNSNNKFPLKEKKVMIVKTLYTSIFAGFGNVLFQLAAAIDLSIKHNYAMKIYNKGMLTSQIPTQVQQHIVSYFQTSTDEDHKQSTFVNKIDCCFKHFSLEEFEDTNVLLTGFMQNIHFVQRYVKLWQYLFQFNATIKKNTFFVHIRNGDYLNNPFHYIDLSDKIKQLIYNLHKNDNNSNFLFISDDIQLVKNNIHKYIPTNFKNYDFLIEEDILKTMSVFASCENGGILSNSTFSLWGGILNKNRFKSLYIPEIWLPTVENNKQDIKLAFECDYIKFY